MIPVHDGVAESTAPRFQREAPTDFEALSDPPPDGGRRNESLHVHEDEMRGRGVVLEHVREAEPQTRGQRTGGDHVRRLHHWRVRYAVDRPPFLEGERAEGGLLRLQAPRYAQSSDDQKARSSTKH